MSNRKIVLKRSSPNRIKHLNLKSNKKIQPEITETELQSTAELVKDGLNSSVAALKTLQNILSSVDH